MTDAPATIEPPERGGLYWLPVDTGEANWHAHELCWRGVRLAVVEGCDDRWFGNLADGWTGARETQLCRHVRSFEDAKAKTKQGVVDLLLKEFSPKPEYDEGSCPGHVASARNPKVCDRCGTHIDSLRPDDDF